MPLEICETDEPVYDWLQKAEKLHKNENYSEVTRSKEAAKVSWTDSLEAHEFLLLSIEINCRERQTPEAIKRG